jgi:ABC-type maltose transport system permease subunit
MKNNSTVKYKHKKTKTIKEGYKRLLKNFTNNVKMGSWRKNHLLLCAASVMNEFALKSCSYFSI